MKKLLTFLLLLFTAFSSFSQLVIEGNGQKITLPNGTYTIKVGEEKPVASLPNCGCESPGWSILSITQKSGDLYSVTYNSCNVNPLNWKVQKDGQTLKSGSVVPTSATVEIDLSGIVDGGYEMVATSTKCNGEARLKFQVSKQPVNDRTGTSAVQLTPLSDPLLPNEFKTGNYVLRYVESRPDDHLDLKLTESNGQLYLSDIGKSLQSANYTLNGWSDPENAGKLENEAIQPYRLYHVVKYSIDAPIRDWWRSMYSPRANAKRSELFFYVVPQSENWNPAGESNNPIGRPAAFAKIPAFQLKNRVYGFEYDFMDESGARLDDLSITFNRKPGKKHLKLYSSVLSEYLRKLPVRKGLQDLTESECIDFANSLPIELIVAFDIEPGPGSEWIINYDGANFGRNMAIVIERLKQRGALAYNWLDVPGKSPNVLKLDDVTLGVHGDFGSNNAQILKYKEAYSRIGDIQKRYNPYSVVSTGYGYNSYDYNLSPTDGNGQNLSPQLTYLKSLDASELWSRAFPEKQQVYFSWPFMEFNVGPFPQNHVVEIPEFGARARRTDNKPLYDPSLWHDNLLLGMLRAKYLFYWSPGPVGWNPNNITAGASQNAGVDSEGKPNFSVFTLEQGNPPITSRNFYIGKESLAINETIKAAYHFSLIQDATDGKLYAPAFSYSRAAKDGSTPITKTVQEISDGSWYVSSLLERQPFGIISENNGKAVIFFQDVFARPGRFTKFQFDYKGRTYEGITEGNRLFVSPIPN